MDANEYQKLALRTECDQHKARYRLLHPDFPPPTVLHGNDCTLQNVRLNHSVVGLAGEVGEIAGLLQKLVWYGKWDAPHNLDEVKAKLKEEYGDLLWYICEGLDALGLTLQEVMEANVRKLQARYPDRYTQELALHRNQETEEHALNFQAPIGMKEDHPNPFGVYGENMEFKPEEHDYPAPNYGKAEEDPPIVDEQVT